jgi:hypothetical protein
MQNQTDDSFNTTLASVSLPSPAATSGWNSSVSSDFGVPSMVSPESLQLENTVHPSSIVPSYDSFDDPISGSRLPSLRSYSNSEDDNSISGVALSHLNVAGSRRSIDFQSPLHQLSANVNDGSNTTYGSIKNNSWSNNRNLLEQQTKQCVSTSFSSSIQNSITFSLPATCNNLKR